MSLESIYFFPLAITFVLWIISYTIYESIKKLSKDSLLKENILNKVFEDEEDDPFYFFSPISLIFLVCSFAPILNFFTFVIFSILLIFKAYTFLSLIFKNNPEENKKYLLDKKNNLEKENILISISNIKEINNSEELNSLISKISSIVDIRYEDNSFILFDINKEDYHLIFVSFLNDIERLINLGEMDDEDYNEFSNLLAKIKKRIDYLNNQEIPNLISRKSQILSEIIKEDDLINLEKIKKSALNEYMHCILNEEKYKINSILTKLSNLENDIKDGKAYSSHLKKIVEDARINLEIIHKTNEENRKKISKIERKKIFSKY